MRDMYISSLKRLCLIFIIFCILSPANAYAEELANVTTEVPFQYPNVGSLFLRVIFSLLLIIVLTYLVLKLIKRQQDVQQGQKLWIKILDYQALGGNRGIYLLEMFSNIYLVSSSEGQIAILKEINPNDDLWLDIKDDLIVNKDIVAPGIRNIFKRGMDYVKSTVHINQNTFREELDQQLNQEVNDLAQRTNQLHQRLTKGDSSHEG